MDHFDGVFLLRIERNHYDMLLYGQGILLNYYFVPGKKRSDYWLRMT